MHPSRHPSSSPRPNVAPARTRVRWDNVMILLVGLVAAAFAVTLILANGTRGDAPATPTTSKAAAPAGTSPSSAETLADGIDMDEARGLVDEATVFLRSARWDEAADRLATVPEELREISGASDLLVRLEESRTRYTTLRSQLDAAIEARQWKRADALLAELATIATPTDELTALQARVKAALDPAAGADAPAPDETSNAGRATAPATTATTPRPRPQASSTTGGGAARPSGSGTRPSGTATGSSAGSSRPQAPAPRPSGGSTSAASGAGTGTSTGAGTSIDDLTSGMTQGQQQELEDALESALAGSELALQ